MTLRSPLIPGTLCGALAGIAAVGVVKAALSGDWPAAAACGALAGVAAFGAVLLAACYVRQMP